MLQRTDIYPVIIENVERLVQQLQLQAFMSSIQAAVQSIVKSCTSWTNPLQSRRGSCIPLWMNHKSELGHGDFSLLQMDIKKRVPYFFHAG